MSQSMDGGDIMHDILTSFGQLTLACVLGGMIGYERQSRRKSAGLRTNILVCLGSCLIMMMSFSIYKSVEGLTNADPARLGAQVVSGIGFLGAGAIMKEGLSITGLTTAACLWVVAGVGLAVGAGFYVEAVMTTALVVITVGTLTHWELKWSAKSSIINVRIYSENIPEQLSNISKCLEMINIDIKSVKIREEYDKNSREQRIILVIEMLLINTDHVKNIYITDSLQKLSGIKGIEVR